MNIDPTVASAVRAWVERRIGQVDALDFQPTVALGGYTGRAVRLSVEARLPTGDSEVFEFVHKRPAPWSAEVAALMLLADVRLPTGRVPELIAVGEDSAGQWILLPYYAGHCPPFGTVRTEVPTEVFVTLASVHAHFASPHERREEGIAVLDAAWWRQLCLSYLVPRLEGALASGLDSRLASTRDEVVRWAGDGRVHEALQILPRTLVHRDMHSLNVVAGTAGTTILDWGEACWGPVFVDLANITTRGSDDIAAYDNAWRTYCGASRDVALDDVGWAWATLQIRAQYLAFPLSEGRVDDCRRMAVEGSAALDLLGHTLISSRS